MEYGLTHVPSVKTYPLQTPLMTLAYAICRMMKTRRDNPVHVLLIRWCHGVAAFWGGTIMDLEPVPLASNPRTATE